MKRREQFAKAEQLRQKGKARLEESLGYLENALRVDKNHADAWNNKGSALGSLYRYEEAIPCFVKAVKIKRDFRDAHKNLANARRLLKEQQERKRRR